MRLLSFTSRLTGYRPINTKLEGGPLDCHGRPLQTLQAWLEGKHCVVENNESVERPGRASHVSTASDLNVLPFGTLLCIPFLNDLYGEQIPFEVCDTGGAFMGVGLAKLDICTRDWKDMMAESINRSQRVVAYLKNMTATKPDSVV